MSAYKWQFDESTGVYKNHSLSRDIRRAAIIDTVVQQFVRPEPGFGKKKGETHNIKLIKNLSTPTNARLNESILIPIDTFSHTSASITVTEWGRGVEYTSLAKDLSSFDLENQVQAKLRDQMSVVLDGAAASAFTASTVYVCAIPTGVSAITWDTDGTPSTSATVNLNVEHMGIIRDCLQRLKEMVSALCGPLVPSFASA